MFKPVQFGKYQLVERIAVGGMAEIFKADLRGVGGFSKPMVVKQILPQYANDDAFVRMFIDEAKTTVSLNHGNIVAVYELGRTNHIYFIAMEYVPGKNLGEILEAAHEQNRPMSIEHAVFVAIEICKGLDYAHRRTDDHGALLGLIHRDISPGNILLSLSGEVKIVDFGIAKMLKRPSSTKSGVIKGTFGYMSPQQIASEPFDHRTDIFSTGVLLHEMLTGRRLFAGTNELDTLQRAREAVVPPPSEINPHVPPAVDAMVLKALAREPDLRYYDASELQLELARFLYASEGGTTAASLSRYLVQLLANEPSRDTRSSSAEGVDARGALAAGLEAQTVRGEARGQKGDGHTQSYAVRSEIGVEPTVDDDGAAAQHDRPEGGNGQQLTNAGPAATRAYGAYAPPEGPELSSETFNEGGTPTGLFGEPPSPRRPHVPRLRIAPLKPAEERPEKTDTHLEALSGPLPATDGSAEPEPRAALTDLPFAPKRRGPRSDESVMALLVRPPTGEHTGLAGPDVSRLEPDSSGIAPAAPAAPGATARGRTIAPTPAESSLRSTAEVPTPRSDSHAHGSFSATVRLFVQGLEHVEPLDDNPELDVIPRSIRPTVLGWIVIVGVFLSSIAFVIYRKTTLLRHDAASSELALLDPADIKDLTLEDEDDEAMPKTGTIRLVVRPANALVMLHLGETPLDAQGLDTGRAHLVRFEREGYRPRNLLIQPAQLFQDKPLSVTLDPAGAGALPALPTEVPRGEPSGRSAKISLRSDPPSATVWRVVGHGDVTLSDIPIRRYYFKVASPGHQMSFVSVSAEQLETSNGPVRESVTLRPVAQISDEQPTDAAGARTAATATGQPPESVSTKAVPRAEAAAKQKKASRKRSSRVSRKRRPTRRSARRRSSKRRTKPRRKTIQLPSWAQ